MLFAAAAILLTAFGFQYIGGYEPCELCLLQRWPYYLAIPSLFLALVLVSAEQHRVAALVFFAVACLFLVNAGIGTYQAGAEWKFWPGPQSCSGDQGIAQSAGGLLDSLKAVRVVRCDEPAFRLFGLSFAGWNVLASFFLFAGAMKAAFLAASGSRA
ncbi:MAG: disulfide bond formation protein B [Hyphomicrobiaceae bacterium]